MKSLQVVLEELDGEIPCCLGVEKKILNSKQRFDSWFRARHIISHVHSTYDYSGPFQVPWVHTA